MKRVLKCISAFIFMFAFIGVANAFTPQEMWAGEEVTFNSVPLVNEDLFYSFIEPIIFADESWNGYLIEIDYDNPTKGTIQRTADSETRDFTINYNYDPAVKKVADSILAELGEGYIYNHLNDIEFINWFIQNKKYVTANPSAEYSSLRYGLSLALFSEDLMKLIKYKNFDIIVGAGSESPLFNMNDGNLTFFYDGVFYGARSKVRAKANFVVYIPEVSYESDNNVIDAIYNRLSKYFDIDTIEKGSTIRNYLVEVYGDIWDNYHEDENSYEHGFSKEGYIAHWLVDYDTPMDTTDEDYDPEDDDWLFIRNEKIIPNVYELTLKSGETINFVVELNDEKSKDDRKVITSDAGTGIEVELDGIIPLDTLIKVARITSGEEYDKIVKVLKNTNIEVFDLNMITNSTNQPVTKLDNGKFKITLPIKEEFQNKELKVYYVDEDGKVEEYEVTISDDGKYASFETDHFSIYTLASTGKTTNPKTGDNLVLYLLVLSASGYALYKARKFN